MRVFAVHIYAQFHHFLNRNTIMIHRIIDLIKGFLSKKVEQAIFQEKSNKRFFSIVEL